MDVLLHAASITNVSSIPIPVIFNNVVKYLFTYVPIVCVYHVPIIKNGAAKFIPMKSIPIYMQSPKAESVAIAALKFPSNPNHGLDRTQSAIMHVTVIESKSIYQNRSLQIEFCNYIAFAFIVFQLTFKIKYDGSIVDILVLKLLIRYALEIIVW